MNSTQEAVMFGTSQLSRIDLAHRRNDGIDVVLWWSPEDDTVAVEVLHLATDESFELSVEGRYPIVQTPQAGATLRVRSSHAVVADLHLDLPVVAPNADLYAFRSGVPRCVRERLGHHEVDGGLDRGR